METVHLSLTFSFIFLCAEMNRDLDLKTLYLCIHGHSDIQHFRLGWQTGTSLEEENVQFRQCPSSGFYRVLQLTETNGCLENRKSIAVKTFADYFKSKTTSVFFFIISPGRSLTFQGDKYLSWSTANTVIRWGLRFVPSYHPLSSLGQLVHVQRITGQTQAGCRVHLS